MLGLPVQAFGLFGRAVSGRAGRRRRWADAAPAAKIDPNHLRAARELRDRWMQRVNENPALLTAAGKYALTRSLPEPTASPKRLLPAA